MELFTLTAKQAADRIKSGEISSVELTKALLKRIRETDEKIGGYITVLSDSALAAAEAVDKKIAAGENTGLLAGVPVSLKDNICTDGALTSCASKTLHNFVPPYDATVVKKLREQDAVIIGKTNMDEFAMGSTTEYSGVKKTRNPYDTDRVPGGSSGGSAAAVSADEAIIALGSDTGGSIRQPAALCGVVGMKTTYGLVSRYGLIAFASSLDQIGPIAKDVSDCALMLGVITGHDPMDSTSLNVSYPDYTKALDKPVKGLKIGVPREYLEASGDPEVKQAVSDSIKKFEDMGAEVGECSLAMLEYALPAYYIISSAEAASNLARFDGIKYGYRAQQYDDLLDLYKKTRSEGFGPEVKRRVMLGTYALSSGYYDAYYKKAQQARTLIKQDFDKAFEKFDILITPTCLLPAWKIGSTMSLRNAYSVDICTVSLNIAGLPGLTVPCAYTAQGLPIGLQFVGKPFGENELLRAGRAFEISGGLEKRRPGI